MSRIKLCERCGGRLPDGGGQMLAARHRGETVAVALVCSTCWDAAGDGVNRTAAEWIAWVDAGLPAPEPEPAAASPAGDAARDKFSALLIEFGAAQDVGAGVAADTLSDAQARAWQVLTQAERLHVCGGDAAARSAIGSAAWGMLPDGVRRELRERRLRESPPAPRRPGRKRKAGK